MSLLPASPTFTRKSFGSDNHARVHPAVLQAIVDANSGDAIAYGGDPWTEAASARLRDVFGGSSQAFFVLNGSGANVFALGLLLRRYEAVICADSAHIVTDECGAPEQILGTKLLTVPGHDGKITPELIAGQLAGRGDEHFAQPGVVAISQTTEFGTCYSLAELEAISSFCHDNDLLLYVDGARLANAAAHLGCELADIAQYADVLSFGATKNGALGAEAVIVMRPELVPPARYVRKQYMQLASKMRFLGAQFLALLENELWRANAAQANSMATRLAEGLAAIPGVGVKYPVQSDAVFVQLDPAHIKRLQEEWFFYIWDEPRSVVRLMTAFDTAPGDVDEFLESIRATAI
jgi:threonine aldolase